MTATYDILVDGEKVTTMTADFAQAGSPLLLDGDSTPFQVADATHNKYKASLMLLRWCYSQGGSLCECDEDGDPMGDVTVAECETVEV